METFAPGLRENIVALTGTLRGIVFFICVAGLIVQVHAARADTEALIRPIIRGVVVVALVATLPTWFETTERTLLSVANVIEPGYTEHPMRAAALLRASVQEENGSTFSLRRVGESLYQAFLWASAKFVVLVGSLLQLPFLLMQYVLKLLCFLFLPIVLALYMVPSLGSIATRYLQQTLAILAWPIGFAVTELVAFHLSTAYSRNIATAIGLAPGPLPPASFASLIGGLLGALWLLLGTIGTPVVMQMLFCSGTPVSAGGQNSIQQLYTMQQVLWTLKSIKTGGTAVPLAAAQAAGKAAEVRNPPGPPAPPASMPAPVISPVAPASDAAGDQRAAAAIAQTQLPKSQTTI